ncbi:nucleoside monophosphate kinase [Candidatus Woesebacteria bacterium]|nr:nucleoside monophosphate kinase [Candidatus Woesebacteria bacterium]
MNIIILGPQASGKGTQAKLLSEGLGLFYFESGNFLREKAERDPRIDEIINKRGELLPDEETFNLVRDYLKEKVPTLDNFILDGYPRSLKQYQLLIDWLKEEGKKIDLAILLNISDQEAVRRLSARVVCEKCGSVYNLITNPPPGGKCQCGGNLTQRPDDRPEAIEKRLQTYHATTAPLIEVLKKDGILVEVDGERPIAVISDDLLKIVAGHGE